MSFVKCRNAELSRVPEQGEVAAVVIRSDDEGDNMTITITAAQTRDLDSIHFDYFKFCMLSFSTELDLDLAVSSSSARHGAVCGTERVFEEWQKWKQLILCPHPRPR